MDISEIVSGRSSFAEKKVGEEIVLVPIKDSVASMDEMFTLNDVGSFIWEQLKDGVTEENLTNALVEEFDVDTDTANADLKEFLAQLEKMLHG